MRGRRAAAWQPSPSQIMAWHLESEPVKCQTGYDRNGDRQIMTDLWPGSSERSRLTQPSVSWCAFRSKGNQFQYRFLFFQVRFCSRRCWQFVSRCCYTRVKLKQLTVLTAAALPLQIHSQKVSLIRVLDPDGDSSFHHLLLADFISCELQLTPTFLSFFPERRGRIKVQQ